MRTWNEPEALSFAEKHQQSAVALEPMPGGASTRKFFRTRASATSATNAANSSAPPAALGGVASLPTAILMFVPDDAPEEISSGDTRRTPPFLEVQALLSARGVRVPAVYAAEAARGLYLLEDLSDTTLAVFLDTFPHRKAEAYTRAVVDLAKAHDALAPASLPEESIVRARAFDEKLLTWEFEHFLEYGLEARGVSLSSSDKTELATVFRSLAQELTALPQGFVHRDYQSRNLMVPTLDPLGLAWIDFQDALMGPRVYDLVALLNDSYQTFDRPFVEARIREYAAARHYEAAEADQLLREFDLVTVQRKLKDAGRFVFIDRVKGNPGFLPFVEPTLLKVRAAIEALPPDPRLRLLHRYASAPVAK